MTNVNHLCDARSSHVCPSVCYIPVIHPHMGGAANAPSGRKEKPTSIPEGSGARVASSKRGGRKGGAKGGAREPTYLAQMSSVPPAVTGLLVAGMPSST